MKKILLFCCFAVVALSISLHAVHKQQGIGKRKKSQIKVSKAILSDQKKDSDFDRWMMRENDECPVCCGIVSYKRYVFLGDTCCHPVHPNCKKDWHAFSGCSHCPLCKVKGDSEKIEDDQMHVLERLLYKGLYCNDVETMEIYKRLLNQLEDDEKKEVDEKVRLNAKALHSADSFK